MNEPMEFLTVSETAKRLRVSSETVRKLCDARIIKAVRFSTKKNGHRKIVASSLNQYIDALCRATEQRCDAIEIERPVFTPALQLDDVIKNARQAVKNCKSICHARLGTSVH